MIKMWEEEVVEALVDKYIRDGQVVAFGTSKVGETFLKKVALKMERENISVSVIPTSIGLASIAASLKLPIASLDEKEVDVAIEFADLVDKNFNFIKRDSKSLVRDKMIAQSSGELIVVVRKENYVKRLHGKMPFEIAKFGHKRSLAQLSKLGDATLRMKGREPFVTETGHYLIDVEVDDVYSLEDVDYQAKEIPGVIETGLFIGYADRVLSHNNNLVVESRLDYSKQEMSASSMLK